MKTPESEPAKRIATLFGRRLTTPWSDKEIRAYRTLVKDGLFGDLTELNLVERYTVCERKKGDKGVHRRDLKTFLNNYRGEVDRANAWASKHRNGSKPHRYASPSVDSRSDEEVEAARIKAAQMVEELRQKLNHQT